MRFLVIFSVIFSSILFGMNNMINFNLDELTYLKNKKEITMCVDPSWMPFESIQNGKHVGIVADIYKHIQKNLPIQIKLIKTKTWSQSLNYAKQKKCDILSAAVITPERKDYLNFSKPYLMFPQVIVTKDKENFIENFKDIIDKKIGVVKDSAIAELLKNKYPNINLIYVKNAQNGLFDVSNGKLYGFVNTSAAMSYAISKNGLTNLKIASKVDINYSLRIAVRKDEVVLLNIFNKLIDKLDKKTLKEIKTKWVNAKVEHIISAHVLYRVTAIFFIIVAIIVYWNRKLQKEIQEKETIQDQLKTQKEQLEKIFLNIPIPILIVSKKDKNIIFANRYSAQIYKIDLKKLVGEKIDIIYTSKNQREQILSAVDENGVLINFETSYKAFDGTHIDALLSLIPIEFNGVDANLGVVTDVTYLKEIQLKLEQESLKAQSATKAKSEFLAKMSHEIRTPMNAVLGMLYLAQQTKLTTIQENYITKANSAAHSLLAIIDDILDFSKIEAGKLSLEFKEFDLNDMLKQIMDVMSFKAQEKGCELLVSYDMQIHSCIISDRVRIGQILTNLITNAIKFTDEGEVIVSVKLLKQEDNQSTIKFCVKDSGIGINKENQKKLFHDFIQADNSITRKFGGTGLGLTISKKLTDMLGGEIWIEDSAVGVGSTFCFTVKVENTKHKKIEKYKFPHELSNLNILVIDDNVVACEVLHDMLKSFGFNIDVVYNGFDGYEAVKQKDYDIVFLDYKMPKLNGIETYKRFKTITNKSIPKTIMITAYSQNDILSQISDLGIKTYLIKPATPSTLYDTILDTLTPDLSKNIDIIKKSEERLDFNGAKILLVEDNELNQDFAKELLQSINISVDIANDGLEALKLIETKSYQLIFMDIQMPNMDGLTATKHIREMGKNDPYFKDIPIIALSANALWGDREKSLSYGMNEHISKPIVPSELFNILKKFLKNFKFVEKDNNSNNKVQFEIIDKNIIDIQQGLNRVGDQEEVYIKLLKQFSTKYETVFTDLKRLQNEPQQLREKIHELKGVSGNISANKLFDTLDKANTILKNGDTISEELFEQININLGNLFDEISKLSLKQAKTKSFNKEKVIKLLDTIKENLESDIVLCEESLERLTPYLDKGYEQFSKELSNALDEFDTDEALKLIDQFLEGV